MKIVVLFGSPNRKGSTSILVEEFRRGAEEAGHMLMRPETLREQRWRSLRIL